MNEIKTYLAHHKKWAGFCAWLVGQNTRHSGRFKKYDVNKSGSLDHEELLTVLALT